MSDILDPSRNVLINNSRSKHGYVVRLAELPVACPRFENLVVFCAEDKRFYECRHITTELENYYKWIAVTTGGQRVYFVPVEALTETELPTEATMVADVRTCSFDAIAFAIDEIALGLYRFGINIDPLCYKASADIKYVPGKKYYTFNNNYDRAQFVMTTDVSPIVGKAYYLADVNLNYRTVFFEEGESFETEENYFESSRPCFIPDAAQADDALIAHRVFESNGIKFEELTKKELVAKLNEIIEWVNVTDCKLDKATDEGTLFDLCVTIDKLIDELNPFAKPWNTLLNRVLEIEQLLRQANLGKATTFDLPITVQKNGKSYVLDITEGDGNRMLTATEVTE